MSGNERAIDAYLGGSRVEVLLGDEGVAEGNFAEHLTNAERQCKASLEGLVKALERLIDERRFCRKSLAIYAASRAMSADCCTQDVQRADSLICEQWPQMASTVQVGRRHCRSSN